MHHAWASEREHSLETHFQSFTDIYVGIMSDVELPGLCLGVPIDHRLAPLFDTELTAPDPSVGPGGHARAIESYGRRLQKSRVDISDNEVNFAKWLAMPQSKGGVVIVLLQPAKHQRYSSNHHETATLPPAVQRHSVTDVSTQERKADLLCCFATAQLLLQHKES
jgi:hypothetical protein